MMLAKGKALGIDILTLENKPGEVNGTSLSITLQATGANLAGFVKEWSGTIQWIAQSPYRPNHKRKNWFAGVSIFGINELPEWDSKDVIFETTRASGPGGQNVNKVETAVRGAHLPTGLQVFVMDSRSQLENKKLCLARLQAKVLALQTDELIAAQQTRWMQHHNLGRGNPVKIIKMPL